jgi:hypothetical protein
MGVFSELWKTQAKDWTYSKIPANKTPNSLAHDPLRSEDGYINVWLQSFRITNVRKGLKAFYGTVYSFISLPVLNGDGGKKAEFQVLTTPGQLKNIDASHVDRILVLNQRLLGPIPYRGGDLEIEIGLFSIKEADLAGPFLSVLDSLSKTAGVSFITAALPFAGPIKDGINLLSGASSDSILEMGLSTNYSPAETGCFAVMRAQQNQVDPAQFRVDDSHRLVDDKSGEPIADFPYLVFTIELSKQRDDFFLIPDLSLAYKKLREEIKGGDLNKINDAFAVFRRTAVSSPDLLLADAQRLVANVDADVKASVETKTQSRGADGTLREFKDVPLYK